MMCSFNEVDGGYSCDNAMTLRTVLKGRLHFTRFMMTTSARCTTPSRA